MNLLDLVVNISAEDKASSQIEGISQKSVAMGSAIGTAIGGLASAAIQKAAEFVVNFGKESIEAGMNFDKAMAQVAATMGVTTADIGDLTAVAKEMGATTSFSATEAAEALNYMALAGYDSETSISMLPNVLNLAAAGAMDLGTASDMVTDSQTALGLSLEETNVLVDQMAQASSKSNTSVQQLGDAILTVGGTAKNLSGGITEMNTVLGLMADNGIKGSEAGTHLRNMILSLTAPTDTAAQALAELGVSATDAEGNMRPLKDIMGDFNVAFADMTAEEKTQALNKIFNKTDLAAVNALLDTNVERWEELGGAIDDAAGSAEQMAQTQLDNLAGDMTLLQSAVEGVQIEISGLMTPALREMTQVATDGLSQMATQLQSGDILGGFQTLGTTVTQVASSLLQALPQFIETGIQMLAGFVKGFAEGLPQMIPALVQSMTGITQVMLENYPLFVEVALKLIEGLAQGIIQAIPVVVAVIPEFISSFVNTFVENITTFIECGIQLFTSLVQAIPPAIVAIVAVLPEIITAIVTALIEAIPQLVEAGITLFMALVEAVPMIIEAILPMVPQIIEALANGFIEAGPKIVEAFQKMMQEVPGKLQEKWNEILDKAGQFITDFAEKAREAGSEFLEKVVEFVSQLPGKVAEFIGNVLNNVGQWAVDMANKARESGENFLNNVSEEISQLPGRVQGWINDIIGSISGWVSDMGSKAMEAGQEFLSAVSDKFGEVVSFFGEVPGRIIGAIGNAGQMLWNIGTQIISGLIGGIKSMIGSAISAVTGALSNIVNTAKSFLGIRSPSRVFAGIGDFSMQGLAKGFEDGSKDAAAVLEDVLDDMTNNSVAIGINGSSGGSAAMERSFAFNVTINTETDALNYGKKIGEALYQEFSRLERRTA